MAWLLFPELALVVRFVVAVRLISVVSCGFFLMCEASSFVVKSSMLIAFYFALLLT